jgi:hypothetical protein
MPSRQEYVISELSVLSWGASVQRANLFRNEATPGQRKDFRHRVLLFLATEVALNYLRAPSEQQHLGSICRLSEVGGEFGEGILREPGYKIGVAQKRLNLHLKYLWCIGIVGEPPHCPVDRVMINKTHLKNQVAWTKIGDIREYERVIATLKLAAEPTGLSLARWELEIYDRADA